MSKILFLIEHLEELSQWIYFEYENSSKIVGKNNLLITNVKRENERKKLSKIANIRSESIKTLAKTLFKDYKIIVLDLKAEKPLKPEDFENERIVLVIGGILGDFPPKGRTYEYITKYLKTLRNVIVRNLGKEQLTIDGSIYVAYMVSKGINFQELKYIHGLRIKRKIGYIEHEIYLPYKYPMVKDKPLISDKLLKYLLKGIVVNELERLKT